MELIFCPEFYNTQIEEMPLNVAYVLFMSFVPTRIDHDVFL